MKLQQHMTVLALGGIIALAPEAFADEIDFEGLPAGTVVTELTKNNGVSGNMNGVIKVKGTNPANFTPETDAAVIFDSDNPSGEDDDLGTPNETFGGPGIGVGGEAGQPFENDQFLHNIIILAEDLVDVAPANGLIDDPDDANHMGMTLDFDFSMANKKGVVTINSVTLVDVEASEGPFGNFIELSGPAISTSSVAVPPGGNNGLVVIDGINVSGVSLMRLNFNGSGGTGAIEFSERSPGPCWITTGGFQNAGIQSGGKDFTFGGNVGPPPSGSWEVIDHNTGDNFHSNDVHIVECLSTGTTGPGQPGGKKGFDIDMALFAGVGSLNHVPGYPFEGFVIDGGEPADKNGNDPDYFEIIVRDPNTNEIVFEASANLDGGNVQIHPPVGK